MPPTPSANGDASAHDLFVAIMREINPALCGDDPFPEGLSKEELRTRAAQYDQALRLFDAILADLTERASDVHQEFSSSPSGR